MKKRPSISIFILISFSFSIFAFLNLNSLYNTRQSLTTAISGFEKHETTKSIPSDPRNHVINASLLELAAIDQAAAAVKKAGEELVIKQFVSAPNEHHSIALHSLREWLKPRVFDPSVMSELLNLVKRPIDSYRGQRTNNGSTLPYKSCAVVGNSGILLNSLHGDLIDSHDIVIRLNNAPTDTRNFLGIKLNTRYAAHVGKKTGLSFINSFVLSWCTSRRSCNCRVYGDDVPIVMYMCLAKHFVQHTICNKTVNTAPIILTDPRFDMLCSRIVKYYSLRRFVAKTGKNPEKWNDYHDVGMFHYSSGMQAVVLAAGICEQVSIFGFGKSAEASHHYHNLQWSELALHDFEAEYEFYRDLADRPGEIPFIRDSGFRLPPVVLYQ